MTYEQASEIAARENRSVEEVQREAHDREVAGRIAPKQTAAVDRARTQAEAAAAKAAEEEAKLRALGQRWDSLLDRRKTLAQEIERAKCMVTECEGTIRTQRGEIKANAGREQHFGHMLESRLSWLASAEAGLPLLKEALQEMHAGAAALESEIVQFAKANHLEHLLK